MTLSNEITWMMNKATISKEYADCVEKKFTGKLPYAMVMKAIKNNVWTTKSEGGQGRSAYWNVGNTSSEKINYGFHYNCSTGLVEFTVLEAKE